MTSNGVLSLYGRFVYYSLCSVLFPISSDKKPDNIKNKAEGIDYPSLRLKKALIFAVSQSTCC